MNRRRFAFWASFGLFSLSEKLRIYSLDDLAAATVRGAEPATTGATVTTATHWRAADNELWRWYERESLVNGDWIITGITTPINKQTGEHYAGQDGYLDESLVPDEIHTAIRGVHPHGPFTSRRPHPMRQARHGRPPSKWLRSLNADELHIWLETVDVPEAGVSGMTYWEHLTRDHSFDGEKIEGLVEEEQAKLHAAAHFGY